MGMENNDLLREQAKKLRQIAEYLYTIKETDILSNQELIDINTELNSVTAELNSIEALLTTSNARLTDIDSATSFSAGYTGSRVLSGTSALTGQFRGFVVNSDAVVSDCLDKDGNSLMTSMGFTGVTLSQGPFHSVSETNWISSITLTSGSIVLYTK
jgi:hypothetical protein